MSYEVIMRIIIFFFQCRGDAVDSILPDSTFVSIADLILIIFNSRVLCLLVISQNVNSSIYVIKFSEFYEQLARFL